MELDFYLLHSEVSEVKDFKALIQTLPNNMSDICSFIQNNLIHSYWIDCYGCEIEDAIRFSDMQIRNANDILKQSELKSGGSLVDKHLSKNKVVSICRDFSLLLCSILREKGVPARIRCGFCKYLTPGRYEDHWVCEYWNELQLRWVMVDGQLDNVHYDRLKFSFDKYDVPASEFMYAGEAWRMCRDQEADAESFGIFNLSGYSFIKGNLVRDLFALSKIELMAWDTGWGILTNTGLPNKVECELLDHLAILSSCSDCFGARNAIESLDELKFPFGWHVSDAPTISELLSKHDLKK
ncbi:transglutaminase-like domain-containing protein [Psychromonas sp. KJ10-10]|uniref:transglutaminase-like domain-containing protein n=1 Tax=Psychromonas sp. KJ10-10 TaxID=3391823 RepID=UPI0039B3CFF7